MAKAKQDFSILDIQNDDEELQFQDFGLTSSGGSGSAREGQTHVFTDFPDSPTHQADTDKLLGDYQDDDEETRPGGGGGKEQLSLWSFEFYQQFFDVDSKRVGDRILWSVIPKPGVSYLELHIRPKPDLYGPFWVCLTLVFAAAIAGNVSNYLQTPVDHTYIWRYDFHKVTLAAGLVFSYAWLLPLMMWSFLRYQSPNPALPLLDLVCLYGYSVSVLVPVCIVWTAPVLWLRWCVGIVAVVLSGVVLVKAVWEGLKGRTGDMVEESEAAPKGEGLRGIMKKIAVVMVIVVAVMHIALAMGFMLYFFTEPNGVHQPSAIPTGAPSLPTPGHPHASDKEIPPPTKRELDRPSVVPPNGDPNGLNPVVAGDGVAGSSKLLQNPKKKPESASQIVEKSKVVENVEGKFTQNKLIENMPSSNNDDQHNLGSDATDSKKETSDSDSSKIGNASPENLSNNNGKVPEMKPKNMEENMVPLNNKSEQNIKSNGVELSSEVSPTTSQTEDKANKLPASPEIEKPYLNTNKTGLGETRNKIASQTHL